MKTTRPPTAHADKLLRASRSVKGVERGAWMLASADRPGFATVSFDAHNLPQPERSFPADCAAAAISHGGLPELQFMQLSRRSNTVQRMVAMRYERSVFVQRIADLAPFHANVRGAVSEAGRGELASSTRRLFDEAQGEPVPGSTLVVDADIEWMMFAGTTAAIVFLRLAPSDRHLLSTQKAEKVWLSAELEITLSREALLGLLDSWQDLVKGMQP